MDSLTLIAWITLIYSLITFLEMSIGFFSIRNLSRVKITSKKKLPPVSIIFSALNEAADIEPAVLSLLQMDYPDFEVIAINDRSQDSTPQILDRLQKHYPRLRVYHLSSLPENWLGKNHALQQGAEYARGQWLLFTDADVHMKPDTLTLAMNHVLQHNLQHLTLNEHHVRKTFGLKILMLGNYLLYSLFLKPWRMRYGWSRKSVGHGAFNLVNKACWFACGAHQTIALECLDDLKLGALLKKKGYRQDIVDGRDFVERAWYQDLADMVRGWRKNSFAFFDYKFLHLLLASILVSILFLWPLFSLICCEYPVARLNALNIILMLMITFLVCREFRLSLRHVFCYPAAICLVFYAIWHSAFRITRQKGVSWRNTFYPLEKLRKGSQ